MYKLENSSKSLQENSGIFTGDVNCMKMLRITSLVKVTLNTQQRPQDRVIDGGRPADTVTCKALLAVM